MSHQGYLKHQGLLAAQRDNKRKRKHMSELVSAAPPTGGITWADHKGALLIIEPLSFESGIKTSFGDADAVKANVTVIKSETESEDYDDCLVFPKLLASQLRGSIGKKVVGRLGQGQAKPGQSAPWLLENAGEDDLKKAQEFLSRQSLTPAAAPSSAPPF